MNTIWTVRLAAVVLVLSPLGAWAQEETTDKAAAQARTAERARINADRAVLQTQTQAKERACYQQFSVNACLSEVRAQRREALAELRRQEIVLNDQEREGRAAKALAGQTEREATHASKALEAAAKPVHVPQAKTPMPAASAAEQAQRAQTAAQRRAAENARKQEQHAGKVADEAQNTRRFEAKQSQAQKRREDRARRDAQATKPTAAPLP